jgi:hypothetical protein
MAHNIKKTADRLLPEVKDIGAVLPEMIRIAGEGDVAERIAKLLVSQGWTSMDLWREVKRLEGVSIDFTRAIEYALRDAIRNPKRSGGEMALQLARAKKWLKPPT